MRPEKKKAFTRNKRSSPALPLFLYQAEGDFATRGLAPDAEAFRQMILRSIRGEKLHASDFKFTVSRVQDPAVLVDEAKRNLLRPARVLDEQSSRKPVRTKKPGKRRNNL
jgi:hypothetical protein